MCIYIIYIYICIYIEREREMSYVYSICSRHFPRTFVAGALLFCTQRHTDIPFGSPARHLATRALTLRWRPARRGWATPSPTGTAMATRAPRCLRSCSVPPRARASVALCARCLPGLRRQVAGLGAGKGYRERRALKRRGSPRSWRSRA